MKSTDLFYELVNSAANRPSSNAVHKTAFRKSLPSSGSGPAWALVRGIGGRSLIFGWYFIRPIDDQDINRRPRRVQTQTELLLKRADQSRS